MPLENSFRLEIRFWKLSCKTKLSSMMRITDNVLTRDQWLKGAKLPGWVEGVSSRISRFINEGLIPSIHTARILPPARREISPLQFPCWKLSCQASMATNVLTRDPWLESYKTPRVSARIFIKNVREIYQRRANTIIRSSLIFPLVIRELFSLEKSCQGDSGMWSLLETHGWKVANFAGEWKEIYHECREKLINKGGNTINA